MMAVSRSTGTTIDNHSGTSSYVVPGERIDEKVSAFYEKVSTPVMTDLEIEIDGVRTFDAYPEPLPDLFVGSQIIIWIVVALALGFAIGWMAKSRRGMRVKQRKRF